MNKTIKSATNINFVSNLLAYLITYSIGFFTSPYIVEKLGADAYGFVSLAISFTTYISIATVALNALASRFVSIAIFKLDYKKASQYYTSVLYANAVITAILVIPCSLFILFIERFIDIPPHLVGDVKILFAIVFCSFFISLLTSLFSVGTFVENKLYLTAVHRAVGSFINLIGIISLFMFFPARVMYVGLVSLIVSFYKIFWDYYYKRKYIPQLQARREYFALEKVWELTKSGSWNLLGQLSGLLNNGFNVLLANLFVSPEAMGVMAISVTLPSIIRAVLGSVTTAFTPSLTKQYAENDFDGMLRGLKKSIQMLGLILTVPMAGLIVFGYDFYKLWQPTQDAHLLAILSIMSMVSLTFSGSTASIHEIFTVENKLKPQAIACFISGIVNFVLVILVLNTTDMGIFAIALVSSILDIIRNFTFTFPYAAKLIKQKWYTFVLLSLKSFACVLIIGTLFFCVREFIYVPTTWFTFFLECLICGVVGFILNSFLILQKDTRYNLMRKLHLKK